jgi:hypothetical protein
MDAHPQGVRAGVSYRMDAICLAGGAYPHTIGAANATPKKTISPKTSFGMALRALF